MPDARPEASRGTARPEFAAGQGNRGAEAESQCAGDISFTAAYVVIEGVDMVADITSSARRDRTFDRHDSW
jgi:hypothetical protein